jgi:threonine dehydrogenase-like Zn-dependent dehydrogenase
MKAARFHGRGDIRVEEVPDPQVRPGTVAVEVEWCGICGTDLHEYLEGPIFVPTAEAPHPLTGESMPVTLGHEFAGVVAEVGPGVGDVRVGDRVVVEPYVVCGRCDACQQGRYNVCRTLGFVGLSGGGGASPGTSWPSAGGSTRSATSARTSGRLSSRSPSRTTPSGSPAPGRGMRRWCSGPVPSGW